MENNTKNNIKENVNCEFEKIVFDPVKGEMGEPSEYTKKIISDDVEFSGIEVLIENQGGRF